MHCSGRARRAASLGVAPTAGLGTNALTGRGRGAQSARSQPRRRGHRHLQAQFVWHTPGQQPLCLSGQRRRVQCSSVSRGPRWSASTASTPRAPRAGRQLEGCGPGRGDVANFDFGLVERGGRGRGRSWGRTERNGRAWHSLAQAVYRTSGPAGRGARPTDPPCEPGVEGAGPRGQTEPTGPWGTPKHNGPGGIKGIGMRGAAGSPAPPRPARTAQGRATIPSPGSRIVGPKGRAMAGPRPAAARGLRHGGPRRAGSGKRPSEALPSPAARCAPHALPPRNWTKNGGRGARIACQGQTAPLPLLTPMSFRQCNRAVLFLRCMCGGRAHRTPVLTGRVGM